MSNKAEVKAMEQKAVVETGEVLFVKEVDKAFESRLTSEILMLTEQTKQVVLFNSIEIGRRLTEAKKIVKHGQWGNWLKERVNYSQRTANNFMKIFQEYGESGLAEKSQSIANLSYTQALTLLDVPQEDRQKFVEENNAKDMTIKELQEKVKTLTSDKDGALLKLEESEKKYQVLIGEKDRAIAEAGLKAEKLNSHILELEQQAQEAEANRQVEIKAKLETAIKTEQTKLQKLEKDKQRLGEEVNALKKEKRTAVEQARKEERALAKTALENKEHEVEKIKQSMKTRLEKAVEEIAKTTALFEEEQAKNQYAGNLAKSAYLIEEVLDSYAELMDILLEIKKRNEKEGTVLLSDLENSMEKIRKKANIKLVVA